MKAGSIVWMGCLALALSASAHAAPESFDVWLKADITIAADGSIESLEWNKEPQARQVLQAKVEPLVRRWEFIPGSVDGRRARTETYLRVQVLGTAQPDGTLMLKFGKASTGAKPGTLMPPMYPRDAVTGGISGAVTSIVAIDAAGVLTLESSEFHGTRYRKQFVAAAESAVKGWTFDLERVAGHPVPAKLSVPISFCVGKNRSVPPAVADCMKQLRKADDSSALAAAPGPSEDAAPLSSVVQLVTQVSGQEI